jgi:ADP-ribose pyrophosphatase
VRRRASRDDLVLQQELQVPNQYTVKRRKSTRFGPFRIDEVTLQVAGSDGSQAELERLNFERGDSVAVLVHDVARQEVVLARQFRYPVLANAQERGNGWLLELPAGGIDEGEDAEQAARREVQEEVGVKLASLEKIATFFVSPGGTSERNILFYATTSEDTGAGGGLASEGEDIEIVRLPVRDFLNRCLANTIRDAKTLLAGYWLQAKLGQVAK